MPRVFAWFTTGWDFAPNRVWRVILCIVGAILFAAVNPFGLLSAADDFSRDAYFAVRAPFHGVGQRDAPATVIVIDDNSLKQSGTIPPVYPPPFTYYAEILNRIADQRPAAIFVDLLFLDDRSETETRILAETLAAWRSSIPIILASAKPRAKDPTPCVERVLPELVGVAGGMAGVYGVTDEPGRYQLSTGTCDRALPSAALDLYRLWCKGAGRDCSGSNGSEEPMVLVWGQGPAESMKGLLSLYEGSSCAMRDASWIEAFGTAARNVVQVVKRRSTADHVVEQGFRCPFLPTVFAHELTSERQDVESAILSLITDKIVFLGADFIGVNDRVFSPVHGLLPGVHNHALAFENLASMDGKIFRPWTRVISLALLDYQLELDLANVIELAATAAIIIWSTLRKRASKAVRRRPLSRPAWRSGWRQRSGAIMQLDRSYRAAMLLRRLRPFPRRGFRSESLGTLALRIFRSLVISLVFLLAGLLLVTLLVEFLHYEPVNWVGVLGVAILASEHRRERLLADCSCLLARLARRPRPRFQRYRKENIE